MKNTTSNLLSMNTLFGLVAGILIGFVINMNFPQSEQIVGTIGRLDSKRNVSITENDIKLRNELITDTLRLSQYKNYITFMYYKSLRNTVDINKVFELISDEKAYNQAFPQTFSSLLQYKDYLNYARADLLSAFQTLENQNADEKLPIIEYLNNVQNAAGRIQNYESIMVDNMIDMETFFEQQGDEVSQNLRNAHDILTVNVLQSALVAQDKPMLRFLEERKLHQGQQGMQKLLNDEQTGVEIRSLIAEDNAVILNPDEIIAKEITRTIENLIEKLNNSIIESSIVSLDKNEYDKAGKFVVDASLKDIIKSTEEYKAGHVPGAVNAFYGSWAIKRGDLLNELPDMDDLVDVIGGAGIGANSLVVLVDKTEKVPDQFGMTRVAWTLKYAGINNIAILNGGQDQWVKEKRTLSQDMVKPQAKPYKAAWNKNLFIDKASVQAKLGKATILDTRAPGFYEGKEKLAFVPKLGRLKGAVNLPVGQLYTKEGLYKSQAELALLVAKATGGDLDKEYILYCDTGKTCTSWAFVMTELFGYKDVKVYDGSSMEWLADPNAPSEP